jgi:hypothetical protein
MFTAAPYAFAACHGSFSGHEKPPPKVDCPCVAVAKVPRPESFFRLRRVHMVGIEHKLSADLSKGLRTQVAQSELKESGRLGIAGLSAHEFVQEK